MANPGMRENLVFTAGKNGYPLTFETWEQAYERIDNAQLKDTPGLRGQVQAILHPTPGEVIPSDAEYAQVNLIPGKTEFEQDGRRYQVHSVDIAMGKVELTDLTFCTVNRFPHCAGGKHRYDPGLSGIPLTEKSHPYSRSVLPRLRFQCPSPGAD